MLYARRCTIVAMLALLFVAAAGAARAAQVSFRPGPQQGTFLQVSDIHFDPLADPALVAKLVGAPAAQWQAIFESATHTPFPRRGLTDTTYPLFRSMLAAAKDVTDVTGKRVHYDYVLNTGDNLAHHFHGSFLAAGGRDADYQGFVIKTLRFVDDMLMKNFGAPLVYAPGNNDAACGDYKVAPHSTMLAQVARDLPLVAGDADARRDFALGGYYVVPHPTVPKHDIIALNSVFWSIKYQDECGKAGRDPGAAELDWLAWTLYREKAAGRTATLAMHIPPGINGFSSAKQTCPWAGTSFWRADVTRRFAALVARYKDVLTASYAGHTHMDDFRLLSDETGTPLLATRITPAVTPVFGNNPAFAVLLYDRADAVVNDSAVIYLANLPQADRGALPDWRAEYDFAKTYGVTDYTPANLAALAQRIVADSGTAKDFATFYPAEAPTPVNPGNLKAYACAQTALTPAAYAACRCPANAPQPSK